MAKEKAEIQERVMLSKSEELKALLEEHRGERHIIAIQNFPDPDAISGAIAHQMISAEFGITTDIVYDGLISHQENLALVRLLDIDLTRYHTHMDLSVYKHSVFIDNQGTTTTLTSKLRDIGIKPLIIVDHHEKQAVIEAKFTDIRKINATATIYTEYIKDKLLNLDKSNPQHIKLATALMHGLRSETAGLIRAKEKDFLAAAFLSNYVEQSILSEILSVKRSRRVIDVIRAALENRMIRHNFSIAGIGFLRYEDRDAIPQTADFLLTEENIHTAVVYGIVGKDGEREVIIGSLRTSKVTLNPDTFLKNAFGKDWQGNYYGGGKYEAGGFEIPIGFLSGNFDEDFMKMKWKVYDSQVKRCIFEEIGVEKIDQVDE
ncbi:MAG: bifunctional oligoribonuclease/PAP phosphatase NrnA [Blastocatellia bacterium]|nr:bifunctional oligoribonuclease/PAP phosphatase NrnA [Blastocatellia bacterium]MBL8193761.1 bifunctional oligoribonuclease/PAP phosphatase NrnA [Blastocatellia bacterium]MBN8722644.1 bifunctional oligoribonuclease/PAP phosphatase NrnA [Acidobacteriota bacterium]